MILDFGSQYTQLIARRVRELNVYCEIHPFNKIPPIDASVRGVILSGSPSSVRDAQAPTPDLSQIKGRLPLLGVCYGAQYLAHAFGGEVQPAPSREYGRAMLTVSDPEDALMKDLPSPTQVWMSHGDTITRVPDSYRIVASTEDVRVAAFHIEGEQTWGIQFHPEVYHSTDGKQLLKNFVAGICGCSQSWTSESFVETTVRELREKLGDDKVVLGLSGGVDSSVAAGLLSRAVGKQLTCVFVDQGLMRKNEGDFVEKTFTSLFDMNFVRVNCQDHFINALKGVSDPEQKRKIIGTEFYKVFWDEIRKQAEKGFFAQGTIYPDCIESGKGDADKIKTHHNKVKMPDDVEFIDVIEPLSSLFKDEVRAVGEKLGIPHELVWRQPFPGPGLGVRIIGEITKEKIEVLQNADWVLRDEMAKNGYEKNLAQFFCVLPGVNTVGVMGDHRTYDNLVAIRAVTTDDFMTADWAKIPYDILAKVSNRITNEVKHVNRVVYDITSKPPGTVEWE